MYSVMYIDLLIYVALFFICRRTGYVLFISMIGAVAVNNGLIAVQYPLLVVLFGVLIYFGGFNNRLIAVIYLVRAFFSYHGAESINEMMLFLQIIIALNTDDSGGSRNIAKGLYEYFKHQTKLDPIHAFNNWIHRAGSR